MIHRVVLIRDHVTEIFCVLCSKYRGKDKKKRLKKEKEKREREK